MSDDPKVVPDIPEEIASVLEKVIPRAQMEQFAKAIPAHMRDQLTTIAPLLAAAQFARSSQYRTVYTDGFRTRIGNSEITLIFSKASHVPGIIITGNIIEEQVEVVMGWTQLKFLANTLSEIAEAYESEVAPIPIPAVWKKNLEGQKQAIRSLGLVPERGVPTAQPAPSEPLPQSQTPASPRLRGRGRRPKAD